MYQELVRKTASRKRAAGQMAGPPGSEDLELSTELLQAAEMAEGFSGRALRKLPFQAHAFFVQVLHRNENKYLLVVRAPNARVYVLDADSKRLGLHPLLDADDSARD